MFDRHYVCRSYVALLVYGLLLVGQALPDDAIQNEPTYITNVGSVAALRLTRGRIGDSVSLGGYRATQDGGQGLFDWRAEILSDDQCNVFAAPQGSWVRRIGNLPWDWKWCGAYGDQLHDDTQAIRAAYRAAARVVESNDQAGVLFQPSPGTYLISAEIQITANHIKTQSLPGGVSVNSTSTRENIFTISAGRDRKIADIVFDGLTLLRSGAESSAGAALSFDFGSDFLVRGVLVYGAGKLFRGILFDRTFQSSVQDTTISNTVAESIVIQGEDSSSNATSDLYVERVRLMGCQKNVATREAALSVGCVRIDDFSGGLFFRDVEVFGGYNGWAFVFNTKLSHTQAGGQNGNAFLSGINTDSSGAIASCGVLVQNWSLVNIDSGSWITAKNCDALLIRNTADHVTVQGSTLGASSSNNSTARAIYDDGSLVKISNTLLKGYSANLGDAVYLDKDSNGFSIGNQTEIEDWHDGLRANTLVGKNYQVSSVTFRHIASDDLVGFGGKANSQGSLGTEDFVGSIIGVTDSDLTSRVLTSSAIMSIPAGADYYLINGTVPIERVPARYSGQKIRLLFSTPGVKIISASGGLGQFVTKTGKNIVTSYPNQMLGFVSDGGAWYELD